MVVENFRLINFKTLKKMNTKKILLYGGGALVIGAITFFVWSFFQKPIIPIGNTTIGLGSNPNKSVTDNTKDNTNDNSKPTDAPVIKEPIGGFNCWDINAPNCTPDDTSIYSDLDKIIHKPV